MSRTYADIMASYAEATAPKSVDQSTREQITQFTGIRLPKQNSLYDSMLKGVPMPEPDELPNSMDLPDQIEIKRQKLTEKYKDYDISEFDKLNLPPTEVAKHFAAYTKQLNDAENERAYDAMVQEHAITDKAIGGQGFGEALGDVAKGLTSGIYRSVGETIQAGSQALNQIGDSLLDGVGYFAGSTPEEIAASKNALHDSNRLDDAAINKLRDTSKEIQDSKSDYSKKEHYLFQQKQEKDKEAAVNTAKALEADGYPEGIATIAEQAIIYGKTIANALQHPTVISDVISESLPSFVVGGAIGKAARASATSKIYGALGNEAGAAYIASEAGSKYLSGVSAKAALGSIGALEGTSNASEVIEMINEVPDKDLQEISPEYKKLRTEGHTEKTAKDLFSKIPYAQTLGTTATGSMLVSKLLGIDKFEGNIFVKNKLLPKAEQNIVGTAKKELQSTGKEGLEESWQEGLGRASTNIAEKSTIDPNKNIMEGVGEDSAMGALAGVGTAGVVQAPKLAKEGTKKTAKVAMGVGKVAATGVTYGLSKVLGKAADATTERAQKKQTKEFEAAMQAAEETPTTHTQRTVPPTEPGNLDEIATTPEAKETYKAISVTGDAPSSIVSRLYNASIDETKTVEERKDLSLMAYQMLEDMEAYKAAYSEAIADGTATPEIQAEAKSVIGAYDAVLNTQLARNIRNAVEGYGLTEDEIDTISQPLYDAIHDGKITPETYKQLTPILQQARINSDMIPDRMVSMIAQIGEKIGLTKSQQTQFQILDKLRKSKDAVSQDILTGSDDGRFVGLDQHQRRIISALERGKPEQAKERLDYLGSFAERMETKAEAFKEAANKMDPKDEPTQVINPQSGQPYTQLDGETPSFVHPVQSAQLIDQIAADARIVRDTHTELSKLFEPEVSKSEPVKEQKQTKVKENVVGEEEKLSKEEEILNELREEQIEEDARKHEKAIEDTTEQESMSKPPKGMPIHEAAPMLNNLVQKTGKPKNTAKMSEADIAFSSTNQVAKWYKPSSVKSAFNTIKNVTQQMIDAAKESTPLLKAKEILGSTVDVDKHTVAEMKTFEEFGKFRDVFSRMYLASIKKNLPKDGENIYWNEARTLYFMEQTKDDKGNVTYAPSQRFIDSLAVAAYQWLGDVAPRHFINDARAMMDILGLDNKTSPNADQAEVLQDLGTDRQNVVDDLSRMAIDTLGIKADNNAPYNVTNGIEKALALDIIQTLHNLGLIESTTLTNADLHKVATGETITKQSSDWTPAMGNTRVFIHPVKEVVNQVTGNYNKANDLFNTVYSPTKEKAGFSLEPITYANEGIHRNRYQSAPEPAIAARNKASSQEHTVNTELADIAFNALGEPIVERILGIQDETNLNVNTFASVDGSNRTIRMMIEGWHKGVAKVEAAGKSLSEVKAYFKYNFGPQLRMNLDSNDWNPQSNKLVRELVTVPPSTYALSNESRRTFHTLAQAQGLGIDIDKQSVETSKAEYAREIATTYRSAIDLLKQAIEGNELSPENKQVIVEAVDKGGEAFRSLHSLVDQARLELAQEAGDKDFTTHTYIEIDGITNGPFNAITQLGLTDASQDTIDLLKKGGFFFGEDGMIYNNYREDTVGFQDLYETSASEGNKAMDELLSYANKLTQTSHHNKAQKEALESADAIRAVSSFIKGIEIVTNDDGSTTFTLGRKFIKNPVTVTVYSGSAKAINTKIGKGIEEVFYNQLTEAIQAINTARVKNDRQGAINAAQEVRKQVDAMNQILKLGGIAKPITRLDSKSINAAYVNALTNFTFTTAESSAIFNTIGKGVGVYTEHAIQSLFAPVKEKSSAMVAATSIMNILFNRAYTKAIEDEIQRKRDAGELSKYESLSRKEMDDIFRRLSVIAPIFNSPLTAGNTDPTKLNRGIMLNTPMDVADTTSDRTGVTSLATTRGSGGKKIKTDTSTIAFESPGVKAMPFLVQSMEASMQIVQRALSNSNSFNVFDALMSSVNNMEEASANINKGVAFSWAKYNLLEDFTARFKQAMERQSLDNIQLTKDEIKELVFSLGSVADGALVDRKTKTLDLPVVVEQLTNLLESYTQEVQDIREALFNSGISSSIDQMTGTGLPHSLKFGKTKTDITDDMTPAEKLEATHKAIKENRSNEEQKQRRREAIADNFTALSQGNESAKSMTLNQENTMKLVQDTIASNPTPTNRLLGKLLGSITKALPKDLVLVTGDRASVEEKFVKKYPEQTEMIKDSKGLIADNTIYMPEPSLETLTHELLHAGTRDAIFQYFSSERVNLTSRQKRAIDNIHKLMNEFLSTDINSTEANEVKQLLNAALAADSPAIAVSEFVAWGLTNPHLSQQLQNIESKGNYITDMVRKLYKYITSIFAPYSNTPAMNSIYTQLMGNVYSIGSTQKVSTPQMLYQKVTNTVNQLSPAQVFSNMKDTKISKTHSRKLENMLQSIDSDIKQYIINKGHNLEGTHTFEDTLILEMIDPTIKKSTEKLEALGWSLSPKERYAHQYLQAVLDTGINDFNFKTNEVERLYSIAKDKLSADSFLTNPGTANQYERDIAQQKYDAIFSGGANVGKGDHKTTRLTNFLALSETSEEFRTALNNITSVRETSEAKDFAGKVKQATNHLVNAMAGIASKTPVRGTVGERLGVLNRELAHFTAVAKKSLMDSIHDKLDTVEGQVAAYIDPKRDNVGEAITRNAAKIKGKRLPALTGWGAMLTASAISNQSANDVRKAIGMIANNLAGNRLGAFASLVHEAMGTHEDNIALHKLKDKTVAAQERAREQIRTQAPKVIKARFKNLTEARTEAIQRGVIDTDMVSLLDNGYTLNQINELLNDNTRMAQEMDAIEQRLLKNKYGMFYVNQARGLGRFMVNGVSPLSHQLFNAKAIANLTATNKLAEENVNSITADVDILASLVALDNSSLTTKQELSSLIEEEADGLTFTTEYYKLLKQDEMGKLSADGSLATVKGYSASINNPNKRITLAPATERSNLEAMGYTMGSRVPRSSNDVNQTPLYLYYSDEGGNPRYVSGAMSTVRTSISGIDISSGRTINGTNTIHYRSPKDVAAITKNNKQSVDALFNSYADMNQQHLMQPVLDSDGSIIAYAYKLSNAVRDTRLEPSQDFAERLGVWEGRIFEEQEAQTMNQELVKLLVDTYHKDMRELKQDEYITLNPKSDDPRIREIYSLMPTETLALFKKAFPNGEIKVRKDLFDNAFGFRRASIQEVFNGSPENQALWAQLTRMALTAVLGDKAYIRAAKADRIWKEVVSNVKDWILMRSVVVNVANYTSNVIHLLNKGIPLKQILTDFGQAAQATEEYKKLSNEVFELERMERITKSEPEKQKIRDKIGSLKDSLARNPMVPLIEVGLFPSIQEKAEVNKFSYKARALDKLYQLTGRMPINENMRTVGKNILITQDSAVYDFMNRTTQYGDFIAKYSLYNHLVSKGKKTSEEAIAQIMDEFVNYNMIPSRTRDFLESMGVTWFLNYKIRIQKIILRSLRENPVRTLMVMNGVGLPNIYEANAITGNFSYNIGIGNVTNGITAHPLWGMSGDLVKFIR